MTIYDFNSVTLWGMSFVSSHSSSYRDETFYTPLLLLSDYEYTEYYRETLTV